MTEQNTEPTPAVHLEQAMVENTRSDTEDTRMKVYQELLFSDLLLALSDTPPDENATKVAQDQNGNSTALNIAILANPNGLKFAAIFTSSDAIRRWRPQGGQYATMRGQDIFKLLEPSPAEVIVLNPGNAPIAVIPKAEYRQLAAGIVPKSSQSPVKMPASNGQGGDNTQQPAGVQISFPSNVFTDEQKSRTKEVLEANTQISAAAIGAILPPNAPNKDNWIRTIFLRTQELEQTPDVLKDFCHNVREDIKKDTDMFTDCQFEVGVMPDDKFWLSLHQNNVVLFDKTPPTLSQANATTH